MLEITQKKSKIFKDAFLVNITLTRGDSAYLTLVINTNDGEYLPQEGDKVHCQVRTAANTGTLLFEQEIAGTGSEAVWHITPDDTNDLEPGTYVWDAQIEYLNGDIFTFIPESNFIITNEVTMHDE